MKFGVIVFPGSNCDRDMMHALQDDLGQEVVMLWHKDRDLSMFTNDDCIVLPGGFSYGDYLRCGAVARFSPMMEAVIEFANNGGKVLGTDGTTAAWTFPGSAGTEAKTGGFSIVALVES